MKARLVRAFLLRLIARILHQQMDPLKHLK
jgi:hypothetical protein